MTGMEKMEMKDEGFEGFEMSLKSDALTICELYPMDLLTQSIGLSHYLIVGPSCSSAAWSA